MKVIETYLETLFSEYPQTPRFLEARTDLQKMMEEQVEELKADGYTETQAVGKVISEFGSLDEVAGELGLQEEIAAYHVQRSQRPYGATMHPHQQPRTEVTLERAQEYCATEQQQAPKRATGMALYILAPAFLMFCLSVSSYMPIQAKGQPQLINPSAGETTWLAIGLVGLMVLVVAGIALTRKAEAPFKKFVEIQENQFETSAETDKWVKQLAADQSAKHTGLTSIAIGLFILSPLAVVIPSVLDRSSREVLLGVGVLLVIVASGLWVLIYKGWATRAAEALDSYREDDFDLEDSSSPIMRVVGAAFWPVLVAIYFFWSFGFDAWDKSWVIFPIGGVFYWALGEVAGALEKNREGAH